MYLGTLQITKYYEEQARTKLMPGRNCEDLIRKKTQMQ
jgi:hypothetical protein